MVGRACVSVHQATRSSSQEVGAGPQGGPEVLARGSELACGDGVWQVGKRQGSSVRQKEQKVAVTVTQEVLLW